MNFLCKLSKFGIIFFYAASFNLKINSNLSAQYKEPGLAYIQEITPFSYPEISRYNSIIQDSNGFIYLGGNNGLLRFNGYQWHQLNLPGPVSVCTGPDGKIIAYGKNYFGYVDSEPDDCLQFKILYKSENDISDTIGNLNKIISCHENLVVLTSSGVYSWANGRLNRMNLPGLPDATACIGDSLLIHIPEKGIYYMYNYAIHAFEQGGIPGQFHVTDILNCNDQILIYSGEKGLQVFKNGNLEIYNPEINKYLTENGYKNGIADRKGNLIISTLKSSLVIHNRFSGTVNYFYTRDGLPVKNINGIYSGESGNLWILYDFNLYFIEWPSAFSFFDSRNGLPGIVNDITRYNQNIYVSTSQGIFILEQEKVKNTDQVITHFTKIDKTSYESRQLINCGKFLLAINEMGIIRISGKNADMIYTGKINTLFRLNSDPGIVLAGTDNGIISLDISSANIICSPVAVNLTLPVRDIAEATDNSMWINCGGEGLYRLSPARKLADSIPFTRYDTTYGFPDIYNLIRLIDVNGKLILFTVNGSYFFDVSANRFLPYLPFRQDAFNGKEFTVMPLSKDYNNNLWLKAGRTGSPEVELWKADYSNADSLKLIRFDKRRFDDSPVLSIYTDPDSVIWIGTSKNLIRYDTKAYGLSAHNIATHIYSILTGTGDHMKGLINTRLDQAESGPVNIRFSQNNLIFNYISTAISGTGRETFQHFLEGYDDTWSDWSSKQFTSFNDLLPGTYIFNVRSQDISGNISEPDKFVFHISVPLLLKWWALLLYLAIILVIIFSLRRWKTYRDLHNRYKLEEIIKERTESLLKEKEKSENLLANILPKDTADELKLTGKATSSKFKMVTVLFADIQGFTKIAEQMNPEKLIDELDRFYFQFDSVCETYNIEKIKTIGDAYMAAGGIPVKNRTNPVEVVLAALQMQYYMKELKKTKADIWDLRIGIHTGSVIAGVVGQKKLSYDIWGDTVNTASRMESSGEIGKVNISATTYELVKDFFVCQYRGKMPVKYKGDIEMHFVTGIRPEFQAEDGVTPNEEFQIHLQGLRLLDLEEFLTNRLKTELPETLYFHNAQHTSHVRYQSEVLGRSENVSSAELLLIRTAALCHDVGYIYTVDGHEEKSVEMAREILPSYRYTEDQIDQVCRLIMATRLPAQPSNLMEKIIIDANFDHIGRVDFLIESDRLFQEYRALGKATTKKEWNELQINFLRNFDFFTSTAQKMREVSREQQIENIIKFS